MTSTLFLLQDVDLGLELLVRSYGVRFSYNHTSLEFLLVDTSKEKTNVVTSFTLVEELAEHLNTGYNCLLWLVAKTDQLNLITYVYNTGFNSTGSNCTTAGD